MAAKWVEEAKAKNKTKRRKKKRRAGPSGDVANNNGWVGDASGAEKPTSSPTSLLTCCFWPRRKNEVTPEPGDPVSEEAAPSSPVHQQPQPQPQTQPVRRFVSPTPPPAASPPPPTSPLPPPPPPLPPPPPQSPARYSPRAPSGIGINVEPRAESSASVVGGDSPHSLTIVQERVSTPPPPAPLTEDNGRTEGTSGVIAQPKSTSPLRMRTRRRIRPEPPAVDPSLGDVAPLDDPKEAVTRCLNLMDDLEWEVTVRGLQTLIRLVRHHPAHLTPHHQQVVSAVTKLVRSLRSQVARVASKAATYLFSYISRSIENMREMEELCAVLLNRTADTNKFLRADCNAALDAMVDRVAPPRAVAIVVGKGARHQNAVVRATCCRLLTRLCTRLGAERALSLPKDARDAVLNTAARCLTEGSLDTRRYAKELVLMLSADSRLEQLLKEAVPTTVLRSVAKVIDRLIGQR